MVLIACSCSGIVYALVVVVVILVAIYFCAIVPDLINSTYKSLSTSFAIIYVRGKTGRKEVFIIEKLFFMCK